MSPSRPAPNRLAIPLSAKETDELDKFLRSDTTSRNTMTLDTLSGYLTAIVVGPPAILPSQWLSGVWGGSDAEAPKFKSAKHAKSVIELLMRYYNSIIWSMKENPDTFQPFLTTMRYEHDSREYLDGKMWARGFVTGISLCRKDWKSLFDNPAGKAALWPILLLGADKLTKEEEELTRGRAQREELAKQIATSVASIYLLCLPRRKEAQDRLVSEMAR